MPILASSAINKLTFKRTRESFEEREIQSKRFVFQWTKISKKSTFLSKGFNFKDSNLVFWIVLTILHPLTAKTSCVTAWYSTDITQIWTCRKKRRTLTAEKNNFKTALRSGNMFCIKFQVFLKDFAFFFIEIQLISGMETCRYLFGDVFSTPYVHGGHHEWLQRWRPSYRSSFL
jgi:hypothetical protein